MRIINKKTLPLSLHIYKNLKRDDSLMKRPKNNDFKIPKYDPQKHSQLIAKNKYFQALTILRHYLKIVSDDYLGCILNAKNVDLFMLTSSVSSPLGLGSDSKPVRIKFGNLETFLTDSSQFGLEPLLIQNFDRVYCYLPSIRGENPDKRHLNQFFHCELEMVGTLEKLIPLIEKYIKILSRTLLALTNTLNKASNNPVKSRTALRKIISIKKFPVIAFDKAVTVLSKCGYKKLINSTNQGRCITYEGEIKLIEILKIDTPIWVKYYDRNMTAFYQKPMPHNPNKTINADLLFPPIINKSLGGEIVGAGQRQNKPKEIYESLRRQGISSKPYEWYINLRRMTNYRTTSGFGLGIERFIAWALAKDDIKDVILYPRLKNISTLP